MALTFDASDPVKRPLGSSEITESLRSLLFGACYGWALPRFCCVCGCFALAPARSRRPAKTRTAPGRPLRKLRSRTSVFGPPSGGFPVPELEQNSQSSQSKTSDPKTGAAPNPRDIKHSGFSLDPGAFVLIFPRLAIALSAKCWPAQLSAVKCSALAVFGSAFHCAGN